MKRLCLYYFENNNTDSHTYVEDVDTAFDKQWYIGELDSNPYASSTEPFVIIPRKSDEEGSEVLTTVDAVNADILRRYAEYFGTNDYTDPSHIIEYSVVGLMLVSFANFRTLIPCLSRISFNLFPSPIFKLPFVKYEYNIGQCMFCNLCVTACPQGAIRFNQEFEQAVFDKSKILYNL